MHGMDNFTTALKAAIQTSGLSQYAIAKLTGADKGQLSRFMHGQRGLTLDSADKVLAGLGLAVRLVRVRKGR